METNIEMYYIHMVAILYNKNCIKQICYGSHFKFQDDGLKLRELIATVNGNETSITHQYDSMFDELYNAYQFRLMCRFLQPYYCSAS